MDTKQDIYFQTTVRVKIHVVLFWRIS